MIQGSKLEGRVSPIAVQKQNQPERSFSTELFFEFSDLLNAFLDLKHLFKTPIHSNIFSTLKAMLDMIKVDMLGA